MNSLKYVYDMISQFIVYFLFWNDIVNAAKEIYTISTIFI